jgi:hypothetical protein
MTPDADRAESPVAAMTARVAALWRAQGEDFLAEHHANVESDVARLRQAVIVTATLPHIDTEAIVDRLKRLDAAAVERLAATRRNAVIDLTGSEVVVRIPNEENGPRPFEPVLATEPDPAEHACRRCKRYVSEEALVHAGARVRPLCMDCALVVAGVRRSR